VIDFNVQNKESGGVRTVKHNGWGAAPQMKDGHPANRSGARARLLIAGVLIAAVFHAGAEVAAQYVTLPSISAPADGQYLQGQVTIKGTTQIPDFSSAEVAFAYASDPTGTWFTIQTASLPVTEDTLAVWDTSLITDGDYTLRLRVSLVDGSSRDATVTVHVRNYTPVPTPTAAVTATQPPVLDIPTAIIIASTETATVTVAPPASTPSALPPNPAGVTPGAIYSGFWRGALVVGVLVLVFGVLARWRRQ